MLEANNFRIMMLVGSIIALAVFIGCFFVAPIVPIDAQGRANYENIMAVDLGDKEYLTGYQAVTFAVQGRTRGSVEYY